MAQVQSIGRDELERLMAEHSPDNDDPESGYALVNVLGEDSYLEEHIPESINIPASQVEEFESRFEKSKPIVVYCASPECPASPQTAQALVEKGFQQVFDYEEGMSDWKGAGNPVASGT